MQRIGDYNAIYSQYTPYGVYTEKLLLLYVSGQ